MAYMQSRGHQHWGPGTSMTLFQKPAYGMGGSCCSSCAHGGTCSGGLGLFESGMDFTAWTWQEWLVVGLGGYMLTSLTFGAKRGARAAGESMRRGVKRGRKSLAKRIAGE